MDDPLSADLDPLAPDIDTDAAAASFASIRRLRRRRRRLLAGAVASLATAGIGLGALALGGGNGDTVVAAGDEPTLVPVLPLTTTAQDVDDARPLTETQVDIIDEALLPDEAPEELRVAFGRVIEVIEGTDSGALYLVEFESETIWEYPAPEEAERAGLQTIEEGVPVLIDPVGSPAVHDSCVSGLVGARVESMGAGRLDTSADPVTGSAWISLSCVDVDEARELWASSGVNAYEQLYQGRINGDRASALVRVLGGRIKQRRLDPVEFGTFDVETVFDMVDDARSEGQDVRAEFDPRLGYPTRLVVVDQGVEILDFASRSFTSAVQEPACETGTGSPLDLSDEPLAWVLTGTFTRWQDPGGCPVRFDVISDNTGSPHCDMDGARFLTIGTPVGSIPEAEAARGYVFDPDRTLAGIGHGDWGSIAGLDAVPDTAVGTGYRSADGFELWIDEADTEYVWGVNGSTVQVWRQTPPNTFLCG